MPVKYLVASLWLQCGHTHGDKELHEVPAYLYQQGGYRPPATRKKFQRQVMPGNKNKNCISSNGLHHRNQTVLSLLELENKTWGSAQLANCKLVWSLTEKEQRGKSDQSHLRENLVKQHTPGFSSANISWLQPGPRRRATLKKTKTLREGRHSNNSFLRYEEGTILTTVHCAVKALLRLS